MSKERNYSKIRSFKGRFADARLPRTPENLTADGKLKPISKGAKSIILKFDIPGHSQLKPITSLPSIIEQQLKGELEHGKVYHVDVFENIGKDDSLGRTPTGFDNPKTGEFVEFDKSGFSIAALDESSDFALADETKYNFQKDIIVDISKEVDEKMRTSKINTYNELFNK